MGVIAENLAAVRAHLPPHVTLVAMSKMHPAEQIREAYDAGQRDFGENYAQELRDKAAVLPPDVRWHFTGSLQRNKVKYVVGRAVLIHDVDHVELAEEIGKRSVSPTAVLVGVNFGEAQKSGVAAAEALALCERIVGVPGVALRGLMCLPPWQEEPEASAPYFAELAGLAERGRARGLPLTELSMGMSHDHLVAIRHGATIVRVGTSIFGERAAKPTS